MADRLRTVEEYKAQAILLGMKYDVEINTMWADQRDPDEGGRYVEFDADTMERLSTAQITERWAERYGRGERSLD